MSGKLSNRSAVAFGGAALALVLLALWFLVVSPERSQAKSLEADVAAAQAELDQKKADLARPFRRRDGARERRLPACQGASRGRQRRRSDPRRRSARVERTGLTLEGFQPTAVIPVTGYYAQPL